MTQGRDAAGKYMLFRGCVEENAKRLFYPELHRSILFIVSFQLN